MAGKLQSIAQLSGSFAVGALLARDLQGTLNSDREGPSLASIFWPRTAHAFTLFRRTTPSAPPPERVKAFHGLGPDGAYTKVYPVELRVKPLVSQFEFSTLRLALLRALIFTYAPLIDAHFKELQRQEKEAAEKGEEVEWGDLPDFNWEEAKLRIPWVLFALARDIVVGIVRILLSWGAVEYIDSRLVWKMVKDQNSSLRAKRQFPFYKRPILVMRTYLRGMVISTLAEFLVSSSLEIFRVANAKRIPRQAKGVFLRRRLTGRAFALTTQLVASSAAAGAVSLIIPPGIVCIGASLAAGFATDMFVTQPAVQEFETQGRITRRTAFITAACSGVVLWCFLPWIMPSYGADQPSSQPALHYQLAT